MFLRIATVALIATFFGGHITVARTSEACADESVAASVTEPAVTEQPVSGNQVAENPINGKPATSAARVPLATPPSDLLYESIRRELSVSQDLRSQSTDIRSTDIRSTDVFSTDIRPWTTIESLLKVARNLDRQAAQMETTGNTKAAALFRSKSSTIRGIAVELLVFTDDTASKQNADPK
jgi:hypothetical protein